jgi:hypothetical protein
LYFLKSILKPSITNIEAIVMSKVVTEVHQNMKYETITTNIFCKFSKGIKVEIFSFLYISCSKELAIETVIFIQIISKNIIKVNLFKSISFENKKYKNINDHQKIKPNI